MRTFQTYVIGALAVMGLVASMPLLAAQKLTSSDLLTNKQVKELVTNAKTPADHVKLQKHFLALAAKYDAESASHADLAQAYHKNPTGLGSHPGSGVIMADHCDRLSASMRQAASDARALASEHGEMATASK